MDEYSGRDGDVSGNADYVLSPDSDPNNGTFVVVINVAVWYHETR
jgi:hypothetical protein